MPGMTKWDGLHQEAINNREKFFIPSPLQDLPVRETSGGGSAFDENEGTAWKNYSCLPTVLVVVVSVRLQSAINSRCRQETFA